MEDFPDKNVHLEFQMEDGTVVLHRMQPLLKAKDLIDKNFFEYSEETSKFHLYIISALTLNRLK